MSKRTERRIPQSVRGKHLRKRTIGDLAEGNTVHIGGQYRTVRTVERVRPAVVKVGFLFDGGTHLMDATTAVYRAE